MQKPQKTPKKECRL